jgi:hypothetical protein
VTNRWLRFVLALIAITAIAATGYRIFQAEQQLTTETRALLGGTDSADAAIETVSEIKAALHAYVAPGQSLDYWSARARALVDKLRGTLLELDRTTASAGVSLAATLDLSDRLAATEQRAREHARANQPLLAGDVLFADARDQLDAIRLQVANARGQLAQAADARHAAVRREQLMWAVAAAGLAALALLSLVPITTTRAEPTSAGDARPPADLAALDEYARVVPASRPATASPAPAVPKAVVSTTGSRPSAMPAAAPAARPPSRAAGRDGIVSAEVMAARSAAGLEPSRRAPEPPATRTTPAVPSPAALPVNAEGWRETAALCTDIATVSDSQEVSALLTRAATLLNAAGIVVWMNSNGGRELAAAASTGYDDRIVARLGTISREADNVTAAAFREASARMTAARGDTPAAMAVPLVSPTGPVGVLSAEIRDVAEVDPQRQALAAILAAQLSMLLGGSAGAGRAGDAGTTSEPGAANG